MSESDERTGTQDSFPENHVVEDMATSFDPKGLRVLAVDDNIVCLNVLLAMLKKCDYKFRGTTDVAEALQLLRENKDDFDIVITDAQRPDMEDFHLLENLRMEFDIPILVLSASQELNDVIKAVKSGAEDYISKPARLDVIKNIWQHVLRKSLSSDHNKFCTTKDHSYAEQFSKSSEESHQKDTKDEAQECNPESKCNDHNNKKKKKKNVRINWTGALHQKFVEVLHKLGKDAKPKQILMSMNEPGLTIQKISNHLQIYKKSKLINGSTQIDPFSNQKPLLNPFNMSLKQKLLHSQIMNNNVPQRYSSSCEINLVPPVAYCGGVGDGNLPLQPPYGVGLNSRMDDHNFMDASCQFSSRPHSMMQQHSRDDHGLMDASCQFSSRPHSMMQQHSRDDHGLMDASCQFSSRPHSMMQQHSRDDHGLMDASCQFSSRPHSMIQQQSLDDHVLTPMPMYDETNFQDCGSSSLQSTLYADSFMGTSPQFSENIHMPLPIQAPLAGQYEGFDLPVCNGEVDFKDEQMNGASSEILFSVDQDLSNFNNGDSVLDSELSDFRAGDYFYGQQL